MKARFELGEHGAVAHALDRLALMPFGHVGADERKRHAFEAALEHGAHVVHQLARDAVLIGGHAQTERAHRPLYRRPVQGGEACPDAQAAVRERAARARKDRRARVVLLNAILELQQVVPRGWKHERVRSQRHAVAQRGERIGRLAAQNPGMVTAFVFA
jgi:hypothetical protein